MLDAIWWSSFSCYTFTQALSTQALWFMWNKDQFKIMELIVLILSYLFTVVFLLVFCVVGTDPESKRLLQHIFEDYEDEETGAMARY